MQKPARRVYPPIGGHKIDVDTLSKGTAAADVDDLLRQVDLCFVMDATGSMQSYIDATRRELQTFAQTLSMHSLKPRMAYALVLYRDHPPEDDTFVTQLTPLSEELSLVQKALNYATADGGGDGPEAVADGLHDAVYNIAWRKGSHKVVMLAGDAPPHGIGYDGDDGFPDGCPCGYIPLDIAKEAKTKGITIFSLGIGADPMMREHFQQIASTSGGKYVPLGSAATLINEIMSLVTPEFGKVEIDRLVYTKYTTGLTTGAIASALGLSIAEVNESIIRLRRKEVIA